MRVCLGGTFHPFHIGHEALLREACRDATALFVGVTDEGMATRPDRELPPWEERANSVAEFLASIHFDGELEINRLTDAQGPAASKDYDAIVVSPETEVGAATINKLRTDAGLAPLQVRQVAHALAEDFLPISSTRIHSGDIDRSGKRLTPIRVSVGSANPVKVNGVANALKRIFGALDLSVRGHSVDSGVPEQPKGDETAEGIVHRATGAMQADPKADYAIGVEAGMFEDPRDGWFDVQGCAILDALGHQTIGWGPAFQYPAWVTKRAVAGEMISDILGPVAGDDRIGGTTGAIGFLTDGRYDRTEFTEQAVMMAFVPRIRQGLYADVAPSS